MESNCLISFLSCCSSRKRTVAPSDTLIYPSFLQNVSTQTPMFSYNPLSSKSESLPILKPSMKISHKPTIMIRSNKSLIDQSSEEYSRQKDRNFTVPPIEELEENTVIKRGKIRQESLPLPFVMNKGQHMPRIFPITPKKMSKASARLPYLKKSNGQNGDAEKPEDRKDENSLVNF